MKNEDFWITGNGTVFNVEPTPEMEIKTFRHVRTVDPTFDALVLEMVEAYKTAVTWAMEGRDWNPISDVLLIAKYDAYVLGETPRTTGDKK